MATVERLVRKDFKLVDKRDEIRNVLGWLSGASDKVPVVTDDGSPIGIVNDRAMMSRRLDDKAKLDSYTLLTRSIPPTATLEDAMTRLREHRAAYLPVADARGKCLGYVTATDVARASGSSFVAADLALPVQALRREHTLGEALHTFSQEYIDYLPVLDGGERVEGVLPRRSVLRIGLAIGGARGRKDAGGEKIRILDDAVGGFMDAPPTPVPAAASFDALLGAIERDGFALVQDRGRLVGIVTPETLFRAPR